MQFSRPVVIPAFPEQQNFSKIVRIVRGETTLLGNVWEWEVVPNVVIDKTVLNIVSQSFPNSAGALDMFAEGLIKEWSGGENPVYYPAFRRRNTSASLSTVIHWELIEYV